MLATGNKAAVRVKEGWRHAATKFTDGIMKQTASKATLQEVL